MNSCVCVFILYFGCSFFRWIRFFSLARVNSVCVMAMVKIFAIKNAIFSLFCHQFIWHGFLPLANACIWYNGYLIFRFETNIFVLVRCLARFWLVLREINWLVAVANYGLQSFSAPFFKKTEYKHFQSIYFPRLDTNIDLVHEFGTQTKKNSNKIGHTPNKNSAYKYRYVFMNPRFRCSLLSWPVTAVDTINNFIKFAIMYILGENDWMCKRKTFYFFLICCFAATTSLHKKKPLAFNSNWFKLEESQNHFSIDDKSILLRSKDTLPLFLTFIFYLPYFFDWEESDSEIWANIRLAKTFEAGEILPFDNQRWNITICWFRDA